MAATSTPKFVVPSLSAIANKATEKAFIRAVAAAVEPGAFLADLFTNDLVEWVCEQIQADLPPDVYGALVAQGKNAMEVGFELDDERKRHARTQAELKEKTAMIASLARDLEAANEHAAGLAAAEALAYSEKLLESEAVVRLQRERDDSRATTQAAVDRLVAAEDRAAAAEARVADLEMALLRVKAAAWDALQDLSG